MLRIGERCRPLGVQVIKGDILEIGLLCEGLRQRSRRCGTAVKEDLHRNPILFEQQVERLLRRLPAATDGDQAEKSTGKHAHRSRLRRDADAGADHAHVVQKP